MNSIVVIKLKVERYGLLKRYKMQNLKKKRGKKKLRECFPSKDRTRVASVIDQHDNHYTTPTADSVSEIKYLYR